MKILHIIQRYPPGIGGAETWCRNIAQFMKDRGIITKIATINLYNIEEVFRDLSCEERNISLGKYDNDNGVFVRRYNLWRFSNNRFTSKIIWFLLNKLHSFDILDIFRFSPHSFEMYFKLFREIKKTHIVHLHTLPYFHNIVGYIIARILKKKIVITPHFHPKHPHYEKKIFYRLMNHCDVVITMSDFERRHLINKGISSNKICILGNTITSEDNISEKEFRDFRISLYDKYRIKENSKKIIFLGRKELYKGIATLFEAMEEVATENTNLDFYLFLAGPDSSDFINKYGSLNNFSRLKIIDFGIVSEIEKICLLKLSDVLVLPSKFEAFGIVFLEAWKFKKPVIGSNVGAIPEVIKNAGLCVEYANIADLKEKLKMVLFNSSLSKNLGETGKKKLEENYSLQVIGKKMFNIYISLKPQKRVLIISHLFPPYCMGGSEIVAYEQSRLLQKMGFDIKIFAGELNNRKPQYTARKERRDFEITRVNLHFTDFEHERYINFSKPELETQFRKVIYETAPDIVHFHNIYPLSLRLIDEVDRMHIPFILTLHDYWGICFKNTLITDKAEICDKKDLKCIHCKGKFLDNHFSINSLLERNRVIIDYFNKADLLISPSRYLMKRFINCGILPDKTHVINNGIDVLKFNNNHKRFSKKIRFGYIGVIREHKGIHNFLKSLSLLSKEDKERISLDIIGSADKEYFDYCKKIVNDFGISNIVHFLGLKKHREIPRVFKYIDILVLPSVWPENSPVSIMEAMATGTPVLASNIGGIPELIEDGVNGFLHRHDDPNQLMENIEKIIRYPQLLREMREVCLKKAQEFDIKKQVSIIAEQYKGILRVV